MSAILENGVLRLDGYVGDYYAEDGFTSADVVSALAQVEPASRLTVHVNSPGGIAFEGAAIHAVLAARPGATDVVVEGVAMSAASLIAMAGSVVTMSAGAVMMIHDPSGFTFGTSDEHTKAIAGLEALATAYARVYADKSGKTVAECREIMKATTWLTPEEAVEAGFADETTERKGAPVAAFDYRVVANAPKHLVAMAKKADWRLPGAEKGPAPKAGKQPVNQKPATTDKERATALSAEITALKATMASAANVAVVADRERRAAIMALPEASGFTALALHLAERTDMEPGAAAAVMSEAAKADTARPLSDAEDFWARRLAHYPAAGSNGAGLNGSAPAPAPVSDLTATMKRRHNIT